MATTRALRRNPIVLIKEVRTVSWKDGPGWNTFWVSQSHCTYPVSSAGHCRHRPAVRQGTRRNPTVLTREVPLVPGSRRSSSSIPSCRNLTVLIREVPPLDPFKRQCHIVPIWSQSHRTYQGGVSETTGTRRTSMTSLGGRNPHCTDRGAFKWEAAGQVRGSRGIRRSPPYRFSRSVRPRRHGPT
jgi:hypothetical protein